MSSGSLTRSNNPPNIKNLMANRLLRRITLPLVGILGPIAIRLARRSMRLRFVNRKRFDRLREKGKPILLAFWHGQLFMMPYAYSGNRISIMISRHQDGEFISRAMESFGFNITRGSTTAGGTMALRAMVKRFRQGFDLAFTPDGPRGPRHRVQPGVIQAARLTGGAILPVSFDCSKKNSSGPGTGSWSPYHSRPVTSCTERRSR